MGLGWQVLIGAETAEKTGGDLSAVLDAMDRVRKNIHVYCVLHTLEFLRRSGRVSWAAAGVGALLQIKPIIEVHEGEVKNIGRVRTFKRALEDLYRLCKEAAPIDRLAILHVNNPTDANEFYESLKPEITPAIGTNIGPGGVGVALVKQSWRT
jgi:DegV family protein with EDD domain